MPRKTHCPRGHEYSPENTRIDKQGYQHCRACNNEARRELTRRKREGLDPLPPRSKLRKPPQ